MFPAVSVSVFSIKRYLERIAPAPRQGKTWEYDLKVFKDQLAEFRGRGMRLEYCLITDERRTASPRPRAVNFSKDAL